MSALCDRPGNAHLRDIVLRRHAATQIYTSEILGVRNHVARGPAIVMPGRKRNVALKDSETQTISSGDAQEERMLAKQQTIRFPLVVRYELMRRIHGEMDTYESLDRSTGHRLYCTVSFQDFSQDLV